MGATIALTSEVLRDKGFIINAERSVPCNYKLICISYSIMNSSLILLRWIMSEPQARVVILILSNKKLLCRYPASTRALCEAIISHQFSMSFISTPNTFLNSKAIYLDPNKNQKSPFHEWLVSAAPSTTCWNLAPMYLLHSRNWK